VLAVIGYDALRYVHHRSDRIAFAALPLLLAAHQLDEAFVWWGLQGHVSAGVGHVAMWIYLLFAFVVLPTYVPCAIRALEPPGRRRSALTAFAVMGAVVSAALLTAMLRGPVTATLGHDHVSYGIHLHAGLLVVGAYVVATCGSALFSGYRRIALFGALNLVGIAILARLGAWVSSGIVGPEPNRLLTAGDLMAGSVWGCAWILWPCLRRGEDTAGIPGAVRPPPQARAGAPSGVVLRMVKSFMRLWQPASRSHSFWAWSRPRRSTRFPCRVWICPNTGSTIALRLA